MKSVAIARIIGELHGERAIQAPFAFIASKKDQGSIERTMLGGVVLAGMCTTESWERWQGTAILIPSRVDLPKDKSIWGRHLENMMTTFLTDPDDGVASDRSFWKESWRPGKPMPRNRS